MEQAEGGGGLDPLIGQTVDQKYKIVRFLAAGGMGAVYEAQQLEPLQRLVAVKILKLDADDPLFRRRFFNEAAMCASLAHPNVVQVFDYGVTADRTCYIVMELLHGESLASLLKREGRLAPDLALQVVADVCSALMEAHRAGFVHRDLKPSNLFVVERGGRGLFVKVLDFGLAKRVRADSSLTLTGTFLGSPHFMSPEQINGGEVGVQADIYNLGLILYRMVTGVLAFKGDVASAVLVAQATKPPPPFEKAAPDLPPMPEIEWVVAKCLMKHPSERFATVEELVKAVEACQLLVQGRIPSLQMELDADGALCLPAHIALPSQLQARILKPQVAGPGREDRSIVTLTVATAVAFGGGAAMVVALSGMAALAAWWMMRGA